MTPKFGTHPTQYGVVMNHGVYENLHVSVEVARGQTTTAQVFLNATKVGTIDYLGKKRYRITRHDNTCVDHITTLDAATTAVVSDAFFLTTQARSKIKK